MISALEWYYKAKREFEDCPKDSWASLHYYNSMQEARNYLTIHPVLKRPHLYDCQNSGPNRLMTMKELEAESARIYEEEKGKALHEVWLENIDAQLRHLRDFWAVGCSLDGPHHKTPKVKITVKGIPPRHRGPVISTKHVRLHEADTRNGNRVRWVSHET